jgi:hypothetical protein
LPEDEEWRFGLSGTYTDSLLEQMERDPTAEGAPSQKLIDEIRVEGLDNKDKFSTFFELARIGLHFPKYFEFMYDLVVNEEVKRLREPPAGAKTTKLKNRPECPTRSPKYKLVKSIRIIRVPGATPQKDRTWTAPSYSFAVRGHWRTYSDPSTVGKDPDGQKLHGRTWIRPFTKGSMLAEQEIDSAMAEPGVTILIKQPLSYAQDIIRSHSRLASVPTNNSGVQPSSGKPTLQWRSEERSKLTAGLRFLIMQRDQYRCCLCGKSASDENNVRLEVDHKVAIDNWGTTVEDNLWTLCHACNRGKSNKEVKST